MAYRQCCLNGHFLPVILGVETKAKNMQRLIQIMVALFTWESPFFRCIVVSITHWSWWNLPLVTYSLGSIDGNYFKGKQNKFLKAGKYLMVSAECKSQGPIGLIFSLQFLLKPLHFLHVATVWLITEHRLFSWLPKLQFHITYMPFLQQLKQQQKLYSSFLKNKSEKNALCYVNLSSET